jgi:hypothetical protein
MGLSSPIEKERLLWHFLGGCGACLSPWVSIQSEDCLFWKCKKREIVQNILTSKYWDTKFAEDSAEWVDEKLGSVYEHAVSFAPKFSDKSAPKC